MPMIYEPFYIIEDNLDHCIDSLFPDINQRKRRRIFNERSNPVRTLKPSVRMDLHEDEEANLVTASFELPGFKKEDVSLDVHNGRLTVSVESRIANGDDERGYAVRERQYGKYSRSLVLPHGIKSDEIKATMENGVLTIVFPKTSPESASKKVVIS